MKLLAVLRIGRGSRAVIALMLVLSIVAPVLALIRTSIPLPAILGLLTLAWIASYLLVDKILDTALHGAMHVLEESSVALPGMEAPRGSEAVTPSMSRPPVGLPEIGVEGLAGADEDQGDISEASLLVWGLVRSLFEEVSGHKVAVYVAVHDEGVIYYIYPENYGDNVYKLIDEDATGDISIARAGDNSYLAILSEDAVEELYYMASEGSGERLVVESSSQAQLLYKLALEIARSYLGGEAPEAYLEYVAYKALVKLSLKGVLQTEGANLEDILNVDNDTKTRIKKQVDEELGSLGSGNPGAALPQ